MVPVVDRLPDLCLLALFRQMTLPDQMSARKVCRRWETLMATVTRKRRILPLLVGLVPVDIFDPHRYLQLLVSEDGSPVFPVRRLTKWNSLQYRSPLSDHTARLIGRTFANVDNLQVAFEPSILTTNSLVTLLELWRFQLVSFKLLEVHRLGLVTRSVSPFIDQLFIAINSLAALECLHLDISHQNFRSLPIISQLKELDIDMGDLSAANFVEMLQKYGEANASLERINYHGYDEGVFGDDSLKRLFIPLNDRLRSCFSKLDFYFFPIRNPEHIATNFASLSTIHLEPSEITFRQLFLHLSKLTKLVELRLDLAFDRILPDLRPHILAQVNSVKAARLCLRMNSHLELQQMKLAWTLPSVQVLKFSFSNRCADCNVATFHRFTRQGASCLRSIFAPLKADCTKLRAIIYKQAEHFGTVEQLLAVTD